MVLPVQVVVLAKRPVAGRVKTRLCPPLTPAQAAEVAAASLADTLDAVRAAGVARRVLALDGLLDEPCDEPFAESVVVPGFDMVLQRGDGLDERISAAFEDAFAGSCLPMLLVGMDTPQLTAELLEQAASLLLRPDVDAVLGDAVDGGWWALGLHWPQPALLLGVPASRPDTGALQRERLAGLRVRDLPVLRDVDTVDDALAVAATTTGSFAATVARLVGAAA